MLRNYTAYVVDAVGLYTKKVGVIEIFDDEKDHRYALNKPMLKYTRPGDAIRVFTDTINFKVYYMMLFDILYLLKLRKYTIECKNWANTI